jgi:hypothetical protein
MDRIRAKTAFKAYVEKYNIENINIRLKIDHTYRVAQFCERISKSLTENASDIELAWLLGLLHDIFTTTPFESLLSQCCLAFELVFEESRGIVKEQGYLNRLMNIHLMSPLREQMDFLREELREYI